MPAPTPSPHTDPAALARAFLTLEGAGREPLASRSRGLSALAALAAAVLALGLPLAWGSTAGGGVLALPVAKVDPEAAGDEPDEGSDPPDPGRAEGASDAGRTAGTLHAA